MRNPLALIFTAPVGSGNLTQAVLEAATGTLGVSLQACKGSWLSKEAWRGRLPPGFLGGTGMTLHAARMKLIAALDGYGVDGNILAENVLHSKKVLLACDMESTVIEQELINEMADLIGARTEIEAITQQAMNGELDFAKALQKRVEFFTGLEAAALAPITDRITLMPGAETMCKNLSSAGCKMALITGGFSLFAEAVCKQLGFQKMCANALEIEDGKLTGQLVPPVIGPVEKRQHLEKLCREFSTDSTHTIAVGDGANDLDMLSAAGVGIAFHAKPKVVDAALQAPGGAVLDHSDLSAVLAFAH